MGRSAWIRFRPFVALVALIAPLQFPFGTSQVDATTAAKPVGTPSVLYILLDEASMWSLLRTDGTINANRFPGFAELARESTWYRDTMTTAQWTVFAVPSMLESRLPTFDKKWDYRSHPKNLFAAVEGTLAYDVQEPVTSLCPKRLCTRAMQKNARMAPSDHVAQIESMVARASVSNVPTLHFVHSVLPHHPWALTPEMRISSNDTEDNRSGWIPDRKRDSYQSHLRQYVALDSVIGSAMRTLKASGNWDDTMVVVTADHGLTFAPGSNIRDKVDPSKKYAMDDVFRVPLFIKYPNQQTAAISNCAVSTMDIVPTVLSVVGVKKNWGFDGKDLTKGCPRRVSRHVHWPDGETDINSHFRDLMKRVAFYDKWIDANGNADDIARIGRSAALVGTSVPDDAAVETRITWRLDRPNDYQTIGSARFAPVPARATGKFTVRRSLGSRTEGLIVVDGTIVGVAAEFAGRRKSSSPYFFSSTLMTSALHPGEHTVELWTATWTAGTPVLRRVGPPVR